MLEMTDYIRKILSCREVSIIQRASKLDYARLTSSQLGKAPTTSDQLCFNDTRPACIIWPELVDLESSLPK